MLSIGEFARLGGVTVRTIRYYDQIGLLEPASVDGSTGYRSYAASSLPRLHRIIALKEMGLSLAQVADLVDGVSVDVLRGMLLMRRIELEAQASESARRLAVVEQHLRYIEQETNVLTDVVIKELPAVRVAAVACEPAEEGWYQALDRVTDAFLKLFAAMSAAGVTTTAPPLMFYAETDKGLVAHAAVDIGTSTLDGDGVTMVDLPAITAATVVHQGDISEGQRSHDEVGPLYGQVAQWAEANGYDVIGMGRDVLIDVTDLSKIVSEHQLPVARRQGSN